MAQTFLDPFSNQWQIALLALVVVMGALVWRQHRQVSKLATTAVKMHEELVRLSRTADDICGLATNTEHTLVANLAEYRLAIGNTSAYRSYLQKLGVAPTGDVEPILEAISDGAMAVSREGKILYANRVLEEATGLGVGVTTQEIVGTYRASDFDGRPMDLASLPVSLVLRGDTLQGVLLRLHPPGSMTDVILSVNGCPARDVLGRVVAAIIVARPVSEEMAMAMAVRNLAEVKRPEEVVPIG